MQLQDKVKAIQYLRPGKDFIATNDEVTFFDDNVTMPNDAELAEALIKCNEKEMADKTEAEAKRQALLDKLGITEDEARLLLS